MSYDKFDATNKEDLRLAEAILHAQIEAAAKIASKPPFMTSGHTADPAVIVTLVQALAANYAARVASHKR